MGLIISVFSNKGGVGKTTTSISLAQALAKEKRKTLIIDMDSQCNTTTRLLQNTVQSIISLYDLLNGNRPIQDCIYTSFPETM